jgi:hypothetical protein
MTDPDPNPLFADGCTAIACYGNAKPERQADPARADEAANAPLVERADRLCMTRAAQGCGGPDKLPLTVFWCGFSSKILP